MDAERSMMVGAAMSLCAHLLVALVLAGLPDAATVIAAEREVAWEQTFEPFGEGSEGAERAGERPTDMDRLEAGGARSAQNVDARDRGVGGDTAGASEAMLLLHRADGILLFDSPLNNLAAAQSQRIRTSRSRATVERRRATPNPHDQPFLASGEGIHRERRPVSGVDATRGARRAPTASVTGGQPADPSSGLAAIGAAGAGSSLGGSESRMAPPSPETDAVAGTLAPSPGVGVLEGRGARRSVAANVAHGRPAVDQGPAATPSDRIDPRIRDDVDAEQLAASLTASWVQSTPRRGPRVGEGRGGVGGGGAPGVGGGRREGGRATSHGPGSGRFAALDTGDARYRMWFLRNQRRIGRALRFPEERALRMDQGVSIYTLTVRRDGSLQGAPRLRRTSGYGDMDRAALAAIEAATPFTPMPDDLAPGRSRLTVHIPIEFENPMVR